MQIKILNLELHAIKHERVFGKRSFQGINKTAKKSNMIIRVKNLNGVACLRCCKLQCAFFIFAIQFLHLKYLKTLPRHNNNMILQFKREGTMEFSCYLNFHFSYLALPCHVHSFLNASHDPYQNEVIPTSISFFFICKRTSMIQVVCILISIFSTVRLFI